VARIIEEVAVKIGADTRGLDKGLKRSKKQVGALSSAFKRLGAVMIGAFSARALFNGFQRTLSSTNDLIKTAKGVGFLATEYEQLTFSLDQVGVSAGSAKIALGDFQKRLSKAVAGTSPQFAKAFSDAGLDIKSLSKMSPAAAFTAALNHLATLRGDPRLAGLTGNVFEEQSGKDILKVIRQWGTYTQAREKFGRRVGTLTKDQQLRVEFLSEELGVYKAQWESLKQVIVANAVPSIVRALEQMEASGVIESLTEGLAGFPERLSEGIAQLKRDLEGIKGTIQSVLPGVLLTPTGQETPQEASERFAGMTQTQRFNELVTNRSTDTPAMSAVRAQARSEANMSFPVTINNKFVGITDQNLEAKVEKATKKALRAP